MSCAVWLQGMGAQSRSPGSALAPSPSCSLKPWQSLRGWWGCLGDAGGAGALQGMCWLHQGPSVGHVLASSDAKEGSQQPQAWLQGDGTELGKRERKDELNSALSFVSLAAGSDLQLLRCWARRLKKILSPDFPVKYTSPAPDPQHICTRRSQASHCPPMGDP